MNIFIQKAIDAAGSQDELAKMLQCTQQNVSFMKRSSSIPAKHCPKISALIGVPLHELRPDIYPSPSVSNDKAA